MRNNILVTVFTPVYNRAYIIDQLYQSLCQQTSRDFEWVVVNDGSTDNIDELIQRYQDEGRIPIRYFKQENGGKHRAINRGVQEANGELFFIVDSDDYILPNAVEWIIKKSKEIIDNDSFAGISGLRIKPDGSKIGGENNFLQIDSDAVEIRMKHHVTGDLAEIYKTEVLKKFPFPDFPGEKFCSEGLIWNRIAMSKKILRYCYQPLYVCEYLNDGLTATRIKCRLDSPQYSMLLYSEALNNKSIRLREIFKYNLLFWRYSENSNKNFFEKLQMVKWYSFLFLPLGVLIRKFNK